MSTNSSHVDERVVQMEFDNKQFEKNVSQTMTTLDKLKAKLKFDDSAKDFRALERASSGVSFDSLAMSISSLNDRFSTFGIVGMTIMQRLTNAAIDLGKQLLSSVSAPLNQIKTGGWNRALNIENAMFKMGGLLKDFEEQRERIDENINYAVSGTAYSYDAAASAMAQLLASGVEFRGESMDMMNALRAISGVAAMTNSEYSEIAHIFTTVAGNGRLMTEQLNQIAGRGINAAATLAEAFGVTEAELREMVSKGKIDFQSFANAMDNAFGEHAKKANDTFTGALSNIKAALSRTGQGFATSLQTYGRDILNAIRPNINNLNKKYLQPLVDDFDSIMNYLAAKAKSIFGDGNEGILYLGWVPRAIRTIENVVLGLIGILEQLKKAFSEIFPKKTRDDVLMFWVRIERATDKFRKAFSDTTSVVDKFKSKVEELTKPVTDAAETLEKTVHTAEELQEITKRVISGEFGNGEQRFKALEELGWNWKEVQNSVNETLGCSFRYEDVQESITEESKKQENYLGRMSGKMSLLEEQEQRYGKEFVANTREAKRYVSETERARDNRLNNLRSTFKGIAAAIKIVAQAGEALNKVILKPLREKGLPMILDAILAKTARLGEKLVQLSNWLEETKFFESFFQGLVDLFWILVSAVSATVGKIQELYNWFTNLEIVQFIIGSIGQFFQDLPGRVQSAKEKIVEFGTALSQMPGVQAFIGAISTIVNKVKEFGSKEAKGFITFLQDFNKNGYGATVVGGFLWVLNEIALKLTKVIAFLKDAWDYFKLLMSPFTSKVAKNVKDFFKNFNLQDFITSIKENGGGLFGLIKSFADTIGGFFQKAFNLIPWDNLGGLIASGMGLYLLFQFGKLLGNIVNIAKSVRLIVGNVNGILYNTKNAVLEYVNQLRVKNIYTIATAIGILTACLVALAFVPTDRLINAAAALTAIALGVAAIFKAIGKFQGVKEAYTIGTFSDAMRYFLVRLANFMAPALAAIGVAGAVLLAMYTFIKVAKAIKEINPPELFKAAVIMLAALGVLGGAVLLLNFLMKLMENHSKGTSPQMLSSAAANIAAMGAALYLMAAASSKFANLDAKSFMYAAGALAVLMAGVAFIMKFVRQGKPKAVAALIIAIAVALNALLIPIWAITKISKSEGGAEGLVWAAKLLGGFMALSIALLAVSSIMEPKNVLALVGSMAAIVAAVGGIIALFMALEKVDISKDKIITIAVMTGVLVTLTAIMGVVAKFGGDLPNKMLKLGASMLAISVSILALSVAIGILGKTLPMFLQGLAEASDILFANLPKITKLVAAVIMAILGGIMASKFYIALTGSEVLTNFITGLSNAWPVLEGFIKTHGVATIVLLVMVLLGALEALIPPFVNSIVNILNTLADTLHARSEEIATAFIKVLAAVLEIILKAAIKALGFIGNIIEGAVNEFITRFDPDPEHIGHTMEAWDEYGSATVTAIDDAYNQIGDALAAGDRGMYGQTEIAAAGATEAMEKNYNPSQAVAAENAAVQQQMAANQPAMEAASASTAAGMTGGFLSNFDMLGAITGPNGFSGVYNVIAQSNPQFAAMMSQYGIGGQNGLESTFTPSKYVSEELDNGIMAVGNAKATGQDAIVTYGTTLNSALRDTVKEGTEETADSMPDWFGEGMADSGYDVSQWSDLNFEGMYSTSKEQAYAAGSESPQEYAQGAIDNVTAILDAGTEMGATLKESLDTAKPDLQSSGSQGGLAFARGISTMLSRVKSEGMRLKNNAVTGTNGVYDSMYRQGSYAGEGFYDGMGSWADAIADRAYKIVKGAVQAAKDAENSNSPSKETRKLGVYFDQGFILGMQDLSSNVNEAAGNVATDALDAMRTAVGKIGAILSTDLDYEPTIRPVMDLSDVEAGAKLINDAIAKSGAFIPVGAVGSTARLAGQFAASDSKLPGSDGINAGNSYVFTQNNYSPKALSRLEIYRQTKNQFAQMKGLTANG